MWQLFTSLYEISRNRALELRPEYGAALHTRGRIFLDQEKLDRALKDFEHVEKIRSNPSPEQLVDTGILLKKIGRITEAKNKFADAQKAKKDWQYTASGKQYQHRLRQLQSMNHTNSSVDTVTATVAQIKVQQSIPVAPEPVINVSKSFKQEKKVNYDAFGNYYALVIGNNAYKHLPKLKTPQNDAKIVGKLLEQKYGFTATIMLNANRETILTELHKYRNTLNRNDNLLIYFAGHGWLDDIGGEGYWLPIDAKQTNITKWISNSSITTMLKAMRAKHVLVVADSCYSGTLSRGIHRIDHSSGYLQRISQKRARSVISSGGVEPVMDSGGNGNHSVFATAFIRSLKENNGILDATELFHQIRRPIMLNSDQTPEYSDIRKAGHDGGDFLFIKRK